METQNMHIVGWCPILTHAEVWYATKVVHPCTDLSKNYKRAWVIGMAQVHASVESD